MLNISLIVAILVLSGRLREPADALALGVLIGGLLQLAIQLPLLIKQGLFRKRFFGFILSRPKTRASQGADNNWPLEYCASETSGACAPRSFIHPRVKEMGRLFLPRTLGIAVYQVNVFVDTILASFTGIVGVGAVAALYYANRIIQFPLALFGIALVQVALPTMSGLALDADKTKLKGTVSFSLRSVITMMAPATVGIAILARPLIKVVFERGSFAAYSTDITSFALLFYCLGLTGYAGIKILASCFYALKDSKTPVKAAALGLGANVVLNLILMWPLKVAGLALATAISVTLNFIILLFILEKRIGKLDSLGLTLGKTILAASIMGAALWPAFYRTDYLLAGGGQLALKLGLSILAAVAIYAGLLQLFAKEEARIFFSWVLRRG